jgi:hypothetical protein
MNEKLLKELGLKKTWLLDKSGYWFESKPFLINDIKMKIFVNDLENYITLGVYLMDVGLKQLNDYPETVNMYKYSDKKIKQLVKIFKLNGKSK